MSYFLYFKFLLEFYYITIISFLLVLLYNNCKANTEGGAPEKPFVFSSKIIVREPNISPFA